MRAVVVEQLGLQPSVQQVPDPVAPPGGVVVTVEATGLCRSDWHAFVGHDTDVVLPHVPGHEWAGTVRSVGTGVERFLVGQRVTAPFVLACGRCASCAAGQQQVCAQQQQPGFDLPGSFAEQVAVPWADTNLVLLPDAVDAGTAALLGCRFATAFRAVLPVGRLSAGERVAVHGCGGVGLSAVMVAVAAGARVVAVDVSADALTMATALGADTVVDATGQDWQAVGAHVRELTDGGAHLSLDALGSEATCAASLAGLRVRGRHVQVGLLPPVLGHPRVPLHLLVARELELLGSHGMPAHAYPDMLALVASGRLRPERMVTRTVDLEAAPRALVQMGEQPGAGVTLIRP